MTDSTKTEEIWKRRPWIDETDYLESFIKTGEVIPDKKEDKNG
jgi:hypothetical protein